MTAIERTDYHTALRLKGDYPNDSVRILCALHRQASNPDDRATFAQALIVNPELLRRVSLINGTFLHSL